MATSAADLRRWIEGFEEASRADLAARRAEGPQPRRSVALALSLLAAARAAAGGGYPVDPRRRAGEDDVRVIWHRLRSRVLR